MLLKPGDLVYIYNIERKLNTKSKYESLYCFDFENHKIMITIEFLKNPSLDICPLCFFEKKIKIQDKICTVIKKSDLTEISNIIQLEDYLKEYPEISSIQLDTHLKNWYQIIYDINSTIWIPSINLKQI